MRIKELGVKLSLEDSNTNHEPAQEKRVKDNITNSTATIAAKMKANSGPDLVIAACTHLTLIKNRETFERKEIIEEMKTATHYWKQSYLSNLSKNLGNLVKSEKLRDVGKDRYALAAQTREEMEQLLAN